MRWIVFSVCLWAQLALAQPPDAGVADTDTESPGRLVPMFDPGAHTRPLCALGFNADASRLITVAEDYTVQVWNTATGERLDVLRMPPAGYDPVGRGVGWDTGAVSTDGRLVAVGGVSKATRAEGRGNAISLALVDVERRTVRALRPGNGSVRSVAFSPDGRTLAAATDGRSREISLFETSGTGRRRDAVVLPIPADAWAVTTLSFSPDGATLISAHADKLICLWDLRSNPPRLAKRQQAEGHTTAITWSPSGKGFVRAWRAFAGNPWGFELRGADGELLRRHDYAVHPAFGGRAHTSSIAFLSPTTLLMSAGAAPGGNYQALAIRVDLDTQAATAVLTEPTPTTVLALGAVSSTGELAALTTGTGTDAVIYRVRDGRVVSRCGANSPLPSVVGWSAPGRSPGFAWSEQPRPGRLNTRVEELEYGFDLARMELIDEVRPEQFATFQLKLGDYSAEMVRNGAEGSEFAIRRGAETTGSVRGGWSLTAATLVNQGDKPPLLAWAYREALRPNSFLQLSNADGSRVRRLLPITVRVRDLAASSDGRMLVASTGTHQLCVYSTEIGSFPLLTFARVRGEWVAWSEEGYYAASPGGERMIGWAISNGPDQLATFHTADKFARHYRRPELLARAVELGSMERALAVAESRAPQVERLLPPSAELQLLEQTGAKVRVEGRASSARPEEPVVRLRLMLDGRPTAERTLGPTDPPTAQWGIEIPPGKHTLSLIAKTETSFEVSQPLVVQGPALPGQQPTLHRICVGINDYVSAPLRLRSAAHDAADLHAALAMDCVGPTNHFGEALGPLLLDRDATRPSVLAALKEARRAAKPGDLVVFHFAGHGEKQEEEFYLLTAESDPASSLAGHAISGDDLRQTLAEFECPVLLLLDACHSAAGARSFRPVTDDLTRSLTDESVGVTVMAAAMANERAFGDTEHGHFTAALLKGLRGGSGVPYDPYDHVLYTHHVYSVVFSEVRRATNGRQNPFLSAPWTAPPLALRDVPAAP